MTTVWLAKDGDRFVAEYYLHAVELRRKFFTTYREAINFAERKTGRRYALMNDVPEQERRR